MDQSWRFCVVLVLFVAMEVLLDSFASIGRCLRYFSVHLST